MQTEKTHIKYLYPQVAEALEELIMSDKTKFRKILRNYRGYLQPSGKRRRLSLDTAVQTLIDNGYDVEITVVTKAQVKKSKES